MTVCSLFLFLKKAQKMTRKYYTFPIGDWSDDGHGKCQYFRVSGDKSIKKVERAHNKCEEKLGFNIRDICGDYEEREIDIDIQNKIIKAKIKYRDPECDDELDVWHYFEDMWTDQLVHLWVDILNHIDPSLNLNVEKDFPMLTPGPGYGMFQ